MKIKLASLSGKSTYGANKVKQFGSDWIVKSEKICNQNKKWLCLSSMNDASIICWVSEINDADYNLDILEG